MQTEIEAKFLHIDHEAMRRKLKTLGATCRQPMITMSRVNLDFTDKKLEKQGGWLRIRDNGDKVTLTYKQLESWSLHGVKEIETTVGDFAAAEQIMNAIGLVTKAYQITRRETWDYNGCELVLDEWPWIDPLLEIEGPDEASVRDLAAKLELKWEDALFGSVEPAYMAEYNITEKEFYELKDIRFNKKPPKWLEERRRKKS